MVSEQDPNWFEQVFSSAEIEELLHGWNDPDLYRADYIKVELLFPRDKAEDFVHAVFSRPQSPLIRRDLLAFASQVGAIVRAKLLQEEQRER